ncbi:T9SS type A sorting domain-containing protein, partial [Flavobacterium caeni]
TFTWAATGNTYTESGAYTNVTTNANGCVHTETLNLTINQATAITGASDQSFVEGSTLNDIVLSTNVTWYASLADALVPQNPIAATTVLTDGATYYAVSLTENCPSEPFAVTVSTFLGTNSFDDALFSVYPNPTFDVVTVRYAKAIEHVSVHNVLGQSVLSDNIDANQGQVDLSHLTAGTYFVKITSGEASKTVKVIKK